MTTITKGSKIEFTPTGMIFEIAKVTETNVSWYVGFNFKGGNGKNNLKMTYTSLKKFNEGLADGTYIIK